jgi:adenylate kinase family enzyme
MARRISVVGVSGNGKTTFARGLASQLGVPYTELDALCHLPGWVEASDDDFRREVEEVMNRSEGWVLDGSYRWKLGDLVLQCADTIVWLDQPLPLVLRRLVTRAVRDIVTKRDLFNGNRQTWRVRLLGAASRSSRMPFARISGAAASGPKIFSRFPTLEVVRLRSPREVDRWLRSQAQVSPESSASTDQR